MSIGRIDNGRPFKPHNGGGGSKPGKPHGRWPMVMIVAADAITLRHAGTVEALLADRSMFLPYAELGRRMDVMLPGWQVWCRNNLGSRKTSWAELLSNRIYKAYYNGTSARGNAHDPSTRGAISKEHWRSRIAPTSPLVRLHADIMHDLSSVPEWERLA
jgi:hypothetical protein